MAGEQKHPNHPHPFIAMKKFEAPNDHPIFNALIEGDAEAVDQYLKEGVDPYLNGVISGGIRGGHIPVMEVLLAGGVELERSFNELGDLPLMRAVEARQIDVIKFLIAKGADVNARNQHGGTALHFAVSCFPESLPYLLEMGAIVDAKADNGRTPFREACRLNQVAAMETLFEAGADIEAADKEGITPFLGTIRSGAEEAMRWLIAHGADIHAKDSRGKSALWWAIECKRPQIAEFLRRKAGQ